MLIYSSSSYLVLIYPMTLKKLLRTLKSKTRKSRLLRLTKSMYKLNFKQLFKKLTSLNKSSSIMPKLKLKLT
jgi:hypothetical protein